MTTRARFREADVKRAASGMKRAGVAIQRIEIDPSGKIIIFPGPQDIGRESGEWADLE